MMPIELPLSSTDPVLLHGDCLALLHELPDASVDVVVTDPPAGIGFMGKPWDSFKKYEPRTERGREVTARLGEDPLLAEAQALLFGLSLSERLDDLPAAESAARVAEALRERVKSPRASLPRWTVGFVAFMADVWSEVDRILKPGGWVCAWALPKTADLAGLAMRAVGWTMHDSLLHLFGSGFPKSLNIGKALDKMAGAEREVVGKHAGVPGMTVAAGWNDGPFSRGETGNITTPATPEAKRWDGWGTALAPGHEQWLLARKPTRLTYARNVLEHGCGALNIDATRTPGEGAGTRCTNRETFHGPDTSPAGRWPANVLLTEGGEGCPVAELDRQSGYLRGAGNKPSSMKKHGSERPSLTPWAGYSGGPSVVHDAGGGASRFFPRFRYQAKARDRDVPGFDAPKANKHPTHKHPELMRWLVRLLTPTAEQTDGLPGIVLDPFMGSGTTGVAAMAERVRFIGIEQGPIDAEDFDAFGVACARIRYAAEAADPEDYSPKRKAKRSKKSRRRRAKKPA